MYHAKKYYTLLGIEPTKDRNVIKKAYRKKAMKYHPDMNPSKNAEEKFIAITNAYEILTGQIKQPSETFVKKPEDIKKEHIRKAKRRYESIKEKEKRKDAQYYKKITSGWQWKGFKIGAIYCCVLSLILWLDMSLPGKTVTLDEPFFTYNYGSNGPSISHENVTFDLDSYLYYAYTPPIRLEYSPFFKDLKSISIIDLPSYEELKNPKNPKFYDLKLYNEFPLKKIYGNLTIYGTFPLAPIILFIPIIIFYYKRPNFNFAIMRLVCIGIIFPFALIVSLMDMRIFKLFYLY